MKKVFRVCAVIFVVSMLFTGCTVKEKEAEHTAQPSQTPSVNYEMKDKDPDADFDIQFVPDNE